MEYYPKNQIRIIAILKGEDIIVIAQSENRTFRNRLSVWFCLSVCTNNATCTLHFVLIEN